MALKDVGVRMVAGDVDGFTRDIGKADKSLDGFFGTVKRNEKTLKSIGIGLGIFSTAMLGISALSLKTASDVEEMTSKFNVVFKDSAEDVQDWARLTGEAMGRSRFMIMEMAASLQDTFVPMGFARDKAAEMSKTLTELAIDVASFNNKLDEDVIRDFQSALVGNTETVRKYGIVITESRIQQELLASGMVKTKDEITEAMKVQARLNLILAGTTDAQGDAVRTADSFANTMKALKASMEELEVTMGQALIPTATNMTSQLNDLIKGLDPGMVSALAPVIVGFGAMGSAVSGLLVTMPGLVALANALKISLLGLGGVLALLPIGLGMIGFGVNELLKQKNVPETHPAKQVLGSIFGETEPQKVNQEIKKTTSLGAEYNEEKEKEIDSTEKMNMALDMLNNAHRSLTESTNKLIESVSILGNAMQKEADRIFQRQLFESGAFGGGGFGNQFDKIWGQTEEENPRRTEDLIEALISGGRTQEALSLERAAGLLNETTTNLQNIEFGKGDVYLDGRKVGTVINDRLGRDLTQRRQIK